MAINNFKPFAVGAGANVMTQADYETLAALLTGFQSGTAQSAQLNKVWRQSSIMAAVLAQFIVDLTGQDAIDDGTTSSLLAGLKSAVGGRLLNVQVFGTEGAFTYTKTAGANWAIGDVQAAGGQGGGSPAAGSGQVGFGTGGHSGARVVGRFSLAGVTTIPITVGAGGSTGGAGAAGQPGGSSSIGTFLTAQGGPGGSVLGPTNGPNIIANSSALPDISVGNGATVITRQVGNSGPPGIIINSGVGISGAGGVSPGYTGSVTGLAGTGVGNPGAQTGSGGGGAFTASGGSSQAGGAGIRGRVIIWEYA